jgi:hypothetical protein
MVFAASVKIVFDSDQYVLKKDLKCAQRIREGSEISTCAMFDKMRSCQ